MIGFPNYKQLDAMDCGPTCLRIISKYYKRNFDIQYLREKSFITKSGVSMLGISDAAESIGFRTTGVQITFDQLVQENPIPCILHWNQNHFIVCYGIKKKRNGDYEIKISDPVGEKYVMNKKSFLQCWASSKTDNQDTGIALILAPTPDFYAQDDISKEKKKSIRYFLKYLQPYRSQVVQLAIGMLVASILAFILPFLTQAVVDQGIGNNNLSFVTLVLIAQLILFITQLAVNFIQNWIVLHVNSRISITLISDFLSKLMRLPIRFFDSKNVGDIMQRIGDNDRIKTFLTGSTLTTIFSFGNFIIFAIILGYYDLSILTVFIIGNVLYLTWILLFMRYRRKLDIARFAEAAAEQSNLVQIVTGMQEIKLNNCEKQQRWKWERIQVKLFKISLKSLALGQYQQIGSIFFSQTTSLLVSFIAAEAVIEGKMTLGMMMAVSYIIGQLSAPISQIIEFSQSAQDAAISLERLNEIHNQDDEDIESSIKINELPIFKTISIENLYFSYDGADRNYAIDGVNLIIPENKVTAIVGASGSGKTTLIKLLLAFYNPNKGQIIINDTLINDINPHLWRQKSAAVMQDGFIFSDTIANNIAVGEDFIDKSRLQKAAEMANIREFIESLPLKYNTKIGMEGSGISQGQKQRLLIARAIYKEPDFILFDEATNALDAKNERIILNNLDEFYKGRTVIIVAHRLSTVQHADKIVVMDSGKIIEEGTHKELAEKKGAYYTLIKNQLELGM